MTTPPSLLYKYEPPTLQTLRNLKTQTIFFGSPKRFNDPYDCALAPRIKPPSPKQIEKFRQKYLADTRMLQAGRQELTGLSDEQLAAMLIGAANNVVEQTIENFLATKGVTCFSETNDNLLMWSHYASSGQGFCLEFNTNFSPFEKVLPVNYSANIPEIDLTESLLENNFEQIQSLYCTKSDHWSYEREWRGIHKQANTAFTYEAQCLVGVYFGPEVSNDMLEIVCLILQGQNEHVKLHKGRRSKKSFRVEFEEFTYKSHLASKADSN